MSQVMTHPEPPQPTRRDVLRATQLGKLDAVFRGRVFDIIREVHLPPGKVFVTQFGNRGRHGYILQDRNSGEQLVVGTTLLRLIHDRYLGVTLPKNLAKKQRYKTEPE